MVFERSLIPNWDKLTLDVLNRESQGHRDLGTGPAGVMGSIVLAYSESVLDL